MTRIGLLSDTHSYLPPSVFEHFEECDEIWHAGDIGNISVADQLADFKPFRAVYGNIDDHKVRATYPLDLVFYCEEMKVWMTHIAASPPRYNQHIRDHLPLHQPDILICGHSHILKIKWVEKLQLLHINPGAAGKHGFHKVMTLVRFSIDKKRIFDCEVIELGKRGAL